MKRLFLMALAAITLVTFSSCSKSDDDNGGGGGGSSSLPEAPYKNMGKTLKIIGEANGVKQIRLMESGAFMVACKGAYASKIAFARAGTRDGDDLYYEFGTYTSNGDTFTFDNGMQVSYVESGGSAEVTITWRNGTTISTTGTIDTSTTVTSGVMTDNLCSRPWVVDRVIAKATFEGVTLGKEFAAPIDLAKVKAWYEENFGTLRDQFDANTIINGIYFDNQGLFAINYKNRNPDVGDWRWQSMDAGSLVYSWLDRARAISLFTGGASVEIDNRNLNLTLKGNVDGKDMEFKFFLH